MNDMPNFPIKHLTKDKSGFQFFAAFIEYIFPHTLPQQTVPINQVHPIKLFNGMSVIAFTDLITYKPMKMAISWLSTEFCNVKMKSFFFCLISAVGTGTIGTVEIDLYPAFCPREIFEEMKLSKS